MAILTKAASSYAQVTGTWSNQTNAYSTTSDDQYASITLSTRNGTAEIRYGFGGVFTTDEIPDGSVINSVKVSAEVGVSNGTIGSVIYVTLETPAGTAVGNVAQTGSTSDTLLESSTTSLTLTDLRTNSILCDILYDRANSNTSETCRIDYASVTVDYTPPAAKAYGQAQADIFATVNNFGQAQAQILIIADAFAQSQTQIVIPATTYNVHGQALGLITTTIQQYAQAQTHIFTTYLVYAQTQTQIKQTYIEVAQAQANIIYIYRVYAQARTWIFKTNITQYAQAQALLNMGIKFGLAGARIISATPYYSVSDTFTKTTSPGWGTADVGGDWMHNTATAFSTNGSQGIITYTSSSSLSAYLLNTVPITNKYSLRCTYNISVAPTNDVYFILRDAYDSGIGGGISIDETSLIRKYIYGDGSGSGASYGSNYTFGETWELKVELYRINNLPSVKVKTWKQGTSEPTDWSIWTTTSEIYKSKEVPKHFFITFSAPSTTVTIDNLIITQFEYQYAQATAQIDSNYYQYYPTGQAQAHLFASKTFGLALARIIPSNPYFSLTDTFTRTVAEGWGQSDTAGIWQADSNTLLSTDGSFGLIKGGYQSDIRQTNLVLAPNQSVWYTRFKYLFTAIGYTFQFYVKDNTDGDGVGLGISLNSAGAISYLRFDGHTLAGTSAGKTYSSNEWWNFKGYIIRQSTQFVYYAATWKEGDTEPSTYSSTSSNYGPGGINPSKFGITASIGSLSSSEYLKIDDLNIYQWLQSFGQAQAQISSTLSTYNAHGQSLAQIKVPIISVVSFRGRNDDGSETTATWKKAEKENFIQPVNTTFRVRYEFQESANVAVASTAAVWKLQAKRNVGGSFQDINATSSVVKAVSSAYVADTTATTDQLTTGTGTFRSGEFDANNGRVGNATFSGNDHSEYEFTIQIIGADVSTGDLLEFKLIQSEVATTPPVINIINSEVLTITVNANIYRVYGQAQTSIYGEPTTKPTGQAGAIISSSKIAIRRTYLADSDSTSTSLNIPISEIDPKSILVLSFFADLLSGDTVTVSGGGKIWTSVTPSYYQPGNDAEARIFITTGQTDASNPTEISVSWGNSNTDLLVQVWEVVNAHPPRIYGGIVAETDSNPAWIIYSSLIDPIEDRPYYNRLYIGVFGIVAGTSLTPDTIFNYVLDEQIISAGSAMGVAYSTIDDGEDLIITDNGGDIIWGTVETSIGTDYAAAIIRLEEAPVRDIGQAQAQIESVGLQTYNSYGQSQVWINQTYQSYGQTQTQVKQTYSVFGQSMTVTVQSSTVYAQAQTWIKQTYAVVGQAGAWVEQTYAAVGQAQTASKAVGYGVGQSKTSIEQTYNSVANVQTRIKTYYLGFAQSQTQVLTTYSQVAQAQTQVVLSIYTYNVYGQSLAQIKQTYQVLGQAQVLIPGAVQVFAQAQTQIEQTYNSYAQSNAWIEQTYLGYANVQAWIKTTYKVYANTQALIETSYWGHAQAQGQILQSYFVSGQSQAQIEQAYQGYAQALTWIEATYSVYAQAQAQIEVTSNGFAQAQALIEVTSNVYAQAQTRIKATYNAYGQSQGQVIITVNAFAQSQAKLNAFGVQAYGQSQAYLEGSYIVFAQSQASILASSYAVANAQARIVGPIQEFGQATVLIYIPVYARPIADISNDGWVRTVID